MESESGVPSSFASWRDALIARPRGIRPWRTREDLYKAVAVDPSIVTTAKRLCSASRTAESTFYTLYGPGAAAPAFIEGEAMAQVLGETAAWTFEPFVEGLNDVFGTVNADEWVRIDALARVTGDWASTHPLLAERLEGAPKQARDACSYLLSVATDEEAATAVALAALDKVVLSILGSPEISSSMAFDGFRRQVADLRVRPQPARTNPTSATLSALARYGEAAANEERTGALVNMDPAMAFAMSRLTRQLASPMNEPTKATTDSSRRRSTQS